MSVFIRSAVYAGLISNTLAIVVCLLFGEFELIARKAFSISIWVFAYLFHKNRGTW